MRAVIKRAAEIQSTAPFNAQSVELLLDLNAQHKKYSECVMADLNGLLANAFAHSEPNKQLSERRPSFEVSGALNFDAFIERSPSAGPPVVTFSQGVLIALDDLFFRAVTNMDFLSKPTHSEGRAWHGCPCMWLESGFYFPNLRYADYRFRTLAPDAAQKIFPDLSPEGQIPFFPSALFFAWPSDLGRQDLAATLTYIALLWLWMHEENHALLGHFDALSDEASKHHDRQIIAEVSGDTASAFRADRFQKFRVMAEWDADIEAAKDIVRIVFIEGNLGSIPPYLRRDPVTLWRMIFVAVGVVCLLFEKSRRLVGDSAFYPSPKARMTTVALGMVSALDPSGPIGRERSAFLGENQAVKLWEAFSLAIVDLQTLNGVMDVRTDDWAFAVQGKTIEPGDVELFPYGEVDAIASLFVWNNGAEKIAPSLGMDALHVSKLWDEWGGEVDALKRFSAAFRNACRVDRR